MSRELIKDLDMRTVLKVEQWKPTLDVKKFESFLLSKKVPQKSIDDIIPKIQDRLKSANPVSGADIPQRIVDYCKFHANQEMDGLVVKSEALMGTQLAMTVEQGRDNQARAEAAALELQKANDARNKKAQEDAAAAQRAQADAAAAATARARLATMADMLGGKKWTPAPTTTVAGKP